MSNTNLRYGVQVGDDGRWVSEHAVKHEAVKAAVELSKRAGRAQLVDFDPDSSVWMLFENGVRVK